MLNGVETKKCKYQDYLKKIEGRVLFIYSNTSIKVNNIELNKEYLNYSTKDLTQNIDELNEKIKTITDVNVVIAFGGGTAIDQAKYICNILKRKVIVVPTMISTNAYATDKVALYKNGKKISLLAKKADVVILDKNILKNSIRMNVYGLVDVLSIYTALNDWDLAIKYNNEVMAKEYFDAKKLLIETIDFINNNTYEQLCDNVYKIYELVGKAGMITNIFGSGKPESGSEHIFAKQLEGMKKIPHAISVSNGIVLMSLLQKKFSKDIYNAINKLKIFEDEQQYDIDIKLLEKAFFSVTIRQDRFTIVNLNNNDYKAVFNKFREIKSGGIA